MKYGPVFYVLGILMLVLAVAMVPCMMLGLYEGHADWKIFATSEVTIAFFGLAFIFGNRRQHFAIGRRETFLLTVLSWVFMAAFGALPFYFGHLKLDYPHAFFEAMSGITTTGSTVLSGLDTMASSILLWRGILHWLGGMGFLVIALAVLPLLQISGMQIFKTQSFSGVEKILPSASQLAVYICLIYVALSALCYGCFLAAGMTQLEAVVHAMSALSTGGFSTSDASLGHFDSRLIDSIAILFMALGSLPFTLYVKMAKGEWSAIWTDKQARGFIKIVAVLSFSVALYLVFTGQRGFLDAAVGGAFTIVTLISTTGFASGDYTLWGPFVIGVAFFVTFLGGCSGSTAGGIKTFRLQILWEIARAQLKSLLMPHGVNHVHYSGKTVDISVQGAISGFFWVYIASWVLFGAALSLTGMDFVTAYTGSATAISNVGPGLGPIIGPAGTFATITGLQAWILSLAMMMGRVELMALLVILMPRFWKG